MSAGALSGVRVLDMTRLAPGPYGTMLLADLGAEVIVVGGGRAGLPVPEVSRGKRFIGLDLKSEAGLEALGRLVEGSDVFVEGFRPGVAQRLGVGYEQLRERNPALVYCSLTGYGQEGPLARSAGHDLNYIAMAGLLGCVGPADGPPAHPLNLLADFGGGGLMAAFGIVAALFQRQRSGEGQYVDVSMVDGVMSMMAMHFPSWKTPLMPGRGRGLVAGEAPFYRSYECADGRYVAVGALEDAFFRALWTGLELEGEPPHHMDPERWPEIERALAGAFAARDRDEWAERFAGSDACVTPVLDPDEAWAHPQTLARHGELPRWEVPRAPRLPADGNELREPDTTDQTEAVLAAAGLTPEEIEAARPRPTDRVQGLDWPPVLGPPQARRKESGR